MIDTIFFTGSFSLPTWKQIIETSCFYNEKCFAIIQDIPPVEVVEYKPIVINFLLYDFWYILILVLFCYIWYLAFIDIKKNYFNM